MSTCMWTRFFSMKNFSSLFISSTFVSSFKGALIQLLHLCVRSIFSSFIAQLSIHIPCTGQEFQWDKSCLSLWKTLSADWTLISCWSLCFSWSSLKRMTIFHMRSDLSVCDKLTSLLLLNHLSFPLCLSHLSPPLWGPILAPGNLIVFSNEHPIETQ